MLPGPGVQARHRPQIKLLSSQKPRVQTHREVLLQSFEPLTSETRDPHGIVQKVGRGAS
jgi:hypothetical protein